MSLTYITSIVQFLIILGVLTQEEAYVLSEGLVAVVSLVTLLGALYGRYRVGGITIFGFRLNGR